MERRTFLKRLFRASFAVIAPISVFEGCIPATRLVQYPRGSEMEMSPIKLKILNNNLILKRTSLITPKEEQVVLIHKKIPLTKIEKYKEELKKLIEGNPETKEDNGKIFNEEDSQWCQENKFVSYNCHAFSLGNEVGLNPNDWIEGKADSKITENTNPMKNMLRGYFNHIKSYEIKTKEGEITEISKTENDKEIKEGDIITFSFQDKNNINYVHSGKIKKYNDKNWVISKFGEGPLVFTPVSNLFNYYHNKYKKLDTIQIYRIKPNN